MEVIQKKQSTNVNTTDKKNSGSEIIQKEEIKDTPFTIITVENKSFGTMGDYRITEPKKTVKEVKEELEKITWNRILQVVMILDEVKEKMKTNNKTNKKTNKK